MESKWEPVNFREENGSKSALGNQWDESEIEYCGLDNINIGNPFTLFKLYILCIFTYILYHTVSPEESEPHPFKMPVDYVIYKNNGYFILYKYITSITICHTALSVMTP